MKTNCPAHAFPRLSKRGITQWTSSAILAFHLAAAAQAAESPTDPAGDIHKLRAALQQATNTGMPVRVTGTYAISADVSVRLKSDLIVDATDAKFIATSKLDGDMFSLDNFNRDRLRPDSTGELITVSWKGGEFNMAKAKVSTVVPITSMTPKGREGTRQTADALSIRGGNILGEVIIDGITVIGTESPDDPFHLAGGDSGILMGGARKATIKNNKFYGIRDAAVYLSASGREGEFGDHFKITNNTVERAYDAFTTKRGADNIEMSGNKIDDAVVGLSVKNLYAGRTATNVTIRGNQVKRTVRPISVQRANNVTIEDNEILELGAKVANRDTAINPHGNKFEAISLEGVQGNNLIRNNTVKGINGSREAATTTNGIVTRFYDGRKTSGLRTSGNHFSRLDQDRIDH